VLLRVLIETFFKPSKLKGSVAEFRAKGPFLKWQNYGGKSTGKARIP